MEFWIADFSQIEMTDILDPNYELPETAQRHKEEETLTDRADKIIEQEAYTDEDIKELHRIKREMSKLYSKANSMWSIAEHNYNITRAKALLESQEKTDKTKEADAKERAENKYWTYRSFNATAQNIMSKIKAIDSICIQWNVERKAEYGASYTQGDR